MYAIRAQSLRRAFPLLLAILLLLAQALALTHRTAHPNTGQHSTIAIASTTSASALDLLFSHTKAACDDFDAAHGSDVNPGHHAANIAATACASAPATFAQSTLARHPHGLSLARAPPRA